MEKFVGVFEDGMWWSDATVAAHWEDFIREYTEQAAALAEKAEEQGENVSIGMANGIYDKADEAIKAAKWLGGQISTACSQILMIHSPSRVFERLGQYVGEGFAIGINESTGAVDRAMGHMMSVTTRRPARRGSSAESAGAAAGGDMVHVTLVLDGEVLGDTMAPIINDKIGAKIAATRR
jgi:hypothetical protein